jgi:hypothetical protein
MRVFEQTGRAHGKWEPHTTHVFFKILAKSLAERSLTEHPTDSEIVHAVQFFRIDMVSLQKSLELVVGDNERIWNPDPHVFDGSIFEVFAHQVKHKCQPSPFAAK